MSQQMDPALVCVSGMAAAGKTSVARELARSITNACYIDRDSVLYGGMLFVNEEAETPNLISFRDYVEKDGVFPNNNIEKETPFGKLTLVYHDQFPTPPNFHARHAGKQSYLVAGRLLEENIRIGKVGILGGFLASHITSGALRKFMDQEVFAGYPTFLIHLKVDIEECYRRFRARCDGDPEAAIRFRPYEQREAFDRLIAQKQPPEPPGLSDFAGRLLMLDTTHKTLDECVEECLSFMESGYKNR